MENSNPEPIVHDEGLRPGQLIAGRFVLGAPSARFGDVAVFDATDARTHKPLSVWSAPRAVLSPEVSAAVRGGIRAASAVKSPDALGVLGLHADAASGALWIATDPLPLRSAAEVLSERLAQGRALSLTEAHGTLSPILAALTVAHGQHLSHGGLCLEAVRSREDGRSVLGALGLGALLRAAARVPASMVAPELRGGASGSIHGDVYAIGAMLYELCTGRPFDPATPATSLVPELPITFDVIVENCTAEAPADRFKSVASLRAALDALVAPPENTGALRAPPPTSTDEDPSAGVPQDSASSPDLHAESPPAPPAPPAAVAAPLEVYVEVEPIRVADLQIHVEVESARAPAPPPSAGAALKELVTEAVADDAPRWMFVRNGLDHGPLTARELIQAIIRDEVLEGDVVFNMDSEERKKLQEWPQYAEFAQQARDKRTRHQHEREVRSAIAEDTVNARAKVLVGAAAVAAAGGLFAVYWKTLGPGAAARRTAELDIPRPNARAVGGAIEVLPPPTPEAVHRARAGGGGGGGGGGFTSYEAAMSAPIDFNMTGGGPAGGTLQDREISGPLNAALGRFAGCASLGAPSNVQMRIAVGGSGAPIGVSVYGGSGAFRGCVVGVARSIRWRAFGGPRVGFSWGFSVQ
jgi:hypothetical protein